MPQAYVQPMQTINVDNKKKLQLKKLVIQKVDTSQFTDQTSIAIMSP